MGIQIPGKCKCFLDKYHAVSIGFEQVHTVSKWKGLKLWLCKLELQPATLQYVAGEFHSFNITVS